MDDMEFCIDVDMGDYVVYNDWVGQVSLICSYNWTFLIML